MSHGINYAFYKENTKFSKFNNSIVFNDSFGVKNELYFQDLLMKYEKWREH